MIARFDECVRSTTAGIICPLTMPKTACVDIKKTERMIISEVGKLNKHETKDSDDEAFTSAIKVSIVYTMSIVVDRQYASECRRAFSFS